MLFVIAIQHIPHLHRKEKKLLLSSRNGNRTKSVDDDIRRRYGSAIYKVLNNVSGFGNHFITISHLLNIIL